MLLHEITLQTPDPAGLARFYNEVFGFELQADAGELRVGASRLRFAAAPAGLTPRYHFAFDVPENQIEAAAAWLRPHVPLLQDHAGTEIFYTETWDAHNLYFRDPAGNIGELIARHALPNASARPFTGASILNVSEIGICAADVRATVAEIVDRTGAEEYQGPGSASFSPVGDAHGLLIVVERGRIWFPETGVPAEPLPVTVATERAGQPLTLQFG